MTKTLKCGCKEQQTTQDYWGTKLFITTKTELCERHQRQKETDEQREQALEYFTDFKACEIYTVLLGMIDQLGDTGVDVSYFPYQARMVLHDIAIKLNKLNNIKNESNTN